MLKFPQELLEMTIDHLHNHKPSLRSCSLVCHTWVNASRHHLFNSVHVWRDARDRAEKYILPLFSDFLRCTAHCAKFIRTLHIVEYFPPWWYVRNTECDVSAVYAVVQLLPRLHTLVLDGILMMSSDTAFSRNATPRHIRTLSLIKANVSPEDFVALTTVLPPTHSIQVLGSPQVFSAIDDSALERSALHNTSFTLRDAHLPAFYNTTYLTLLRHQAISHITHFDITLARCQFAGQIKALNRFLTRHGSIICYLRVDYSQCDGFQEDPFNLVTPLAFDATTVRLQLESCLALDSYAVRLRAHRRNKTPSLRQWRYIINQLQHLPVSIREMTFAMDEDDWRGDTCIPESAPWSDMDTALEKLKNLIAIQFRLELAEVHEPWFVTNAPFRQHWRDRLCTQLPGAVSRGLLIFTNTTC